MLEWTEYLKLLVGVFSIANPIAAIPIYLEISENQTKKEKKRIVLIASLSVFLILISSLLVGDSILQFFGITLNSFRIAGGIMIILIALRMLKGGEHGSKHTIKHEAEYYFDKSIAVIPLTMPLMVGPGAISTIIIYSQKNIDWDHFIIIGVVIITVTLIIFVSLYFADFIYRLLGKTGLNILTRIMSIFLTAIGVEFIMSSLKDLFPGLQ